MSVTMIILLAIAGELLLAVAVGKMFAAGNRRSAPVPALVPDLLAAPRAHFDSRDAVPA